MSAEAIIDYETLEDVRLAQLLGARDANAVRLVTTRNNQRLFRTAWSILGHRAEAEDAVQSAYLRAFAAIDGFEGRSSLSTWLTRIVINQAIERLRRRRRDNVVSLFDDEPGAERNEEEGAMVDPDAEDPERMAMRAQMRRLLERKIDAWIAAGGGAAK